MPAVQIVINTLRPGYVRSTDAVGDIRPKTDVKIINFRGRIATGNEQLFRKRGLFSSPKGSSPPPPPPPSFSPVFVSKTTASYYTTYIPSPRLWFRPVFVVGEGGGVGKYHNNIIYNIPVINEEMNADE